jgi:hypothetical protein
MRGAGLGHSLVCALAQQLDARVEIKADGKGTLISIYFDTDPRPKSVLHNIQVGAIPTSLGLPIIQTGLHQGRGAPGCR